MVRGRTAAAIAVALLGSLLAACGGSGDEGGVPTLRWYVYNEPSGAFREDAARCTKAAKGRYRIETVNLPNNADEQREQFRAGGRAYGGRGHLPPPGHGPA